MAKVNNFQESHLKKQNIAKPVTISVKPLGSLNGFLYTLLIGFGLYFLLLNVKNVTNWLPYETTVKNVNDSMFYKLVWFFMNFTEPQFYAGFVSSIAIILGGFVAWLLSVKKSSLAGFAICYGTNLWPWIFASQILSLGIVIFVLNFTRFFEGGEYTWIPTFITVVGVPPAIILLYGPSVRVLLTGSIFGGMISFPIAFWFMTKIIPVLDVPVVVGNVTTMAITGIVIFRIFHIIPWMKKVQFQLDLTVQKPLSKEKQSQQMMKPKWFVRRVFADFSEAQFYGNEIAGFFLLIGVSIDWIINSGHVGYGSGAVPAIILSQFVGSGVGVLLYTFKYVENGWYATFVPVVSVGPACVLMFGATIPVAVFAGLLGGIMGSPVAEYFSKKLPEYVHPTVGNVTSMAVCTIIVAVIMKVLPWF